MSKEVSIETAEAAAAAKAPYWDPPPAPLLDTSELKKWSLYRALIAEFVATLIFLYVSIATVIGYKAQSGQLATCTGVGFLGVAWSFGATIFILVYCTGGVSGGHINPAVTFGLFVGRKLSLVRTVLYIVAQCLGAICGVGIVKGITGDLYKTGGGGVNSVGDGFSVGSSLAAEILGTFVLVYTVFSATDPKRTARDSFIPVLVPLPIGFAVFVVHLATIPITGTGINPARSLGAAVMDMKFTNHGPAFCFAPSPQNLRTGPGHQTNIRSMYMMHIFVYAQWIFWVGPAIGAIGAALYHKLVLRGEAVKALGSFRSTSATV